MADKADKGIKRKRQAQGPSKPSKKVAIEEDRNIKISLRDAEKWAPVIGMEVPSI
jgi:DNA-directed RNA polymerase I subunit RPA49